MKLKFKHIIIWVILLLSTTGLYAQQQEIYRTVHGQITITGQVGDTTLMMQSNKLIITLNYETAELIIRINKSTLLTEPNLDMPVYTADRDTDVIFRGKLGIDHVVTQKHPPNEFSVEGLMAGDNEQTLVIGTGKLIHLHSVEYACILNMDFEVSPELLDIDWPGEEKVKIQIIQTVLKRANE